jgi:hypothetical protein
MPVRLGGGGGWLVLIRTNGPSPPDTAGCAVVSNLVGNKRRMIDIGKNLTFYFRKMFENAQFFRILHLKCAKSAIMSQTNFFVKNINMGIKKECYADFKFLDADLNKCPLKKGSSLKYEFLVFSFLCIFSCFFLLLTLFKRIFENQHKILRLIPNSKKV